MTKIPELGRTKNLAVKGDILMRINFRALLSSILLAVFVLSMVATVYTESNAMPGPRLLVCCTYLKPHGAFIEGVKRYGMPDATCSYELCLEVGDMCECAIHYPR